VKLPPNSDTNDIKGNFSSIYLEDVNKKINIGISRFFTASLQAEKIEFKRRENELVMLVEGEEEQIYLLSDYP